MAPLYARCQGLRALLPGRYHDISSGLGNGSGLPRVGDGRSLGSLWHDILHARLDEHKDAHALGNRGKYLQAVLEEGTEGEGEFGATCALALLGRRSGGLCLWHDGKVRKRVPA